MKPLLQLRPEISNDFESNSDATITWSDDADITTITFPYATETWSDDTNIDTITFSDATDVQFLDDGITFEYFEWSSDLTITDGISYSSGDYELTIPLDLKCQDEEFITIKDHKMVCQKIYKQKEDTMYSLSSILFIALIAFVVCKWIAPKLTLKVVFKGFIKLILRPFKREKKFVENTWDEARAEEQYEKWR